MMNFLKRKTKDPQDHVVETDPEVESSSASLKEIENEAEVEKRLVRILDYRLMIWAFFGYFSNGLDRNNMPFAFTNGMEEELNLNSSAYNWAITMFFIGYIILQIPANAIITKVRPRFMLPGIVVLWGMIVCFMALVKDYRGLYGLRICLGFCEAPFYPGIVFLLGSWYTRKELGARTAFFVAGSQVSGAFSGLISGAIAETLDGAHGLRGWKWLFIIEGLIAVFVGAFGFFLLPDFPHNTRFIKGELRELALKRLERQGNNTAVTGLNMATLRNVITTPYIYIFTCIFICMQLGMGMHQNFPIILQRMGYSTSVANYLMIPVWVWAGAVIITQGYLSDRFLKNRSFHIIIGGAWTLLWYILLVAIEGGHVPLPLLMVSIYMLAPVLGISPIMMTWNNEIHACDAETRALAIAIVNSLGNLAPNFINVAAWKVTDAPAFRLGKIVTMSTTIALVLMTVVVFLLEKYKIRMPKPQQQVTDISAPKTKAPSETNSLA